MTYMAEEATVQKAYKALRVKDATVLNMGMQDIIDATEIRKAVHSMFLNSHSNPIALVACFEALDQFWTMIKFACAPGQRKKLELEFTTTRKLLCEMEDKYTLQKKLSTDYYRPLRFKIRNLIDKIYFIKQNAGLGIPVERARDAETMLDDAVRE